MISFISGQIFKVKKAIKLGNTYKLNEQSFNTQLFKLNIWFLWKEDWFIQYFAIQARIDLEHPFTISYAFSRYACKFNCMTLIGRLKNLKRFKRTLKCSALDGSCYCFFYSGFIACFNNMLFIFNFTKG